VPLFVGGTGLYLRGVLRGVFDGPPADWTLRQRLQAEAREGRDLHTRLAQVDPTSAERLHPNDQRRIVRALEVFELAGRPASEFQQQVPLPERERPKHVYWLSPARDWLYRRIDKRVEQMIADGLVAEVSQLLQSSRPLSRTARQALGYREVIEHLSGECTLDAAVSKIQTSTRQFAKRQHTWFRNLEECHSIPMTGTESSDELVEQILTHADEREHQQPS
jgi:tRNA dimethylallyltransferase